MRFRNLEKAEMSVFNPTEMWPMLKTLTKLLVIEDLGTHLPNECNL